MIHYNHESALVNFGLGGSLYSHTGNSLHSTAEVNKIRGYMGEGERERESKKRTLEYTRYGLAFSLSRLSPAPRDRAREKGRERGREGIMK